MKKLLATGTLHDDEGLKSSKVPKLSKSAHNKRVFLAVEHFANSFMKN